MNIGRTLLAQNIQTAEILLDEFFCDNNDRVKFCVECMVKDDYSHEMFK